jgi:hypothetical protein
MTPWRCERPLCTCLSRVRAALRPVVVARPQVIVPLMMQLPPTVTVRLRMARVWTRHLALGLDVRQNFLLRANRVLRAIRSPKDRPLAALRLTFLSSVGPAAVWINLCVIQKGVMFTSPSGTRTIPPHCPASAHRYRVQCRRHGLASSRSGYDKICVGPISIGKTDLPASGCQHCRRTSR